MGISSFRFGCVGGAASGITIAYGSMTSDGNSFERLKILIFFAESECCDRKSTFPLFFRSNRVPPP